MISRRHKAPPMSRKAFAFITSDLLARDIQIKFFAYAIALSLLSPNKKDKSNE
jgi:hypothetical protein